MKGQLAERWTRSEEPLHRYTLTYNMLSFLRRALSKPKGTLPAILLLALALRLLFFVGMTRADDYNYAQAAYNLATGSYQVSGGNLHHQARLSIVLPVAISFHLFGVNEYASELWPLLSSLGSIMVIFYLGKTLFDRTTGLVAALLLSFFPLEVLYSTQLLPDIIQPFLLALSALCFLKGHDTGDRKASYAWFSFSWLAVAAAFFARESAVFILLFYLAYAVYKRTVRPEFVAAGATMGALAVAAGLVYSHVQGNPLVGFGYIARLIHFGTPDYILGTATYFASTWLDYPRMLTSGPYFIYFTIATAAAFACLVRRRERRLHVPALWLLTLLLYLEILSSLHYMRRLDRYLTIITIPALLIVARFLVVLVTRAERVKGLSVPQALRPDAPQRLANHWLQKLAPWSSAMHWGFYGLALCLLLAGIVFSPSFVRAHLSPDGILEAKTLSIIQNARLGACAIGAALAASLLVSRKRGWRSMLERPLGVLAKIFGRASRQIGRPATRRLLVGLVIGFLFAQSVAYLSVAAPRWRYHTFRYREAGHLLTTLPARDIYLPGGPSGWFGRINFYLGFDTGYNLFGSDEENRGSILKPLPEGGLDRLEDSYVVLDPWILVDGEWVIGESRPVPDWWQVLARIPYAGADTAIYYTAPEESPLPDCSVDQLPNHGPPTDGCALPRRPWIDSATPSPARPANAERPRSRRADPPPGQ